MKRVFFVVAIPVLIGLSASALAGVSAPQAGASRDTAAQEPDTVPEVSGMVYIPPGEFLMGSSLEDLEGLAEQDEYPQRSVWLDGYYIDVHEVTNVEYKVFVDSMGVLPPHLWVDGNYPVGQDGFPVVDVSWEDARSYAEFVGKRLPTEEEWEKAARGTDGRRYPWGNEFNTHLVNREALQPVMSNPGNRSPYGLFDMAGNAAEWVDAWYAAYPLPEGEKIPKDFAHRKQSYREDSYRVYRGGSWNTLGKYLRCANREREKPEKKWRYIGFRCAMDPPWKQKKTEQ
jgi:formylglycine-generating enzyme required for sulfatase activity